MDALVLLCLATSSQKKPPSITQMLPPALAVIQYRRLAPAPRVRRPLRRLTGTFSPNAGFFAICFPGKGQSSWAVIDGGKFFIDLNQNGRFETNESRPITTSKPGARRFARAKWNDPAPRVRQILLELESINEPPNRLVGFSAELKGYSLHDRKIFFSPSRNPAEAPVYDLEDNWTLDPDYVNMAPDVSRGLYSPGKSAKVYVELGSLGLGRFAFLGRFHFDIPTEAVVEAKYTFRNSANGKKMSYLATLRERC